LRDRNDWSKPKLPEIIDGVSGIYFYQLRTSKNFYYDKAKHPKIQIESATK